MATPNYGFEKRQKELAKKKKKEDKLKLKSELKAGLKTSNPLDDQAEVDMLDNAQPSTDQPDMTVASSGA